MDKQIYDVFLNGWPDLFFLVDNRMSVCFLFFFSWHLWHQEEQWRGGERVWFCVRDRHACVGAHSFICVNASGAGSASACHSHKWDCKCWCFLLTQVCLQAVAPVACVIGAAHACMHWPTAPTAWLLIGHNPVVCSGPVFGDPCYKAAIFFAPQFLRVVLWW